MKTIKVAIIPLLPVYIFGIFLNITFEGEVVRVLSVFLKIIGVIFVLHIGVLLIQFCIAGALTKNGGNTPFSSCGVLAGAAGATQRGTDAQWGQSSAFQAGDGGKRP